VHSVAGHKVELVSSTMQYKPSEQFQLDRACIDHAQLRVLLWRLQREAEIENDHGDDNDDHREESEVNNM
jgi:hypothetical protein